MKVFLIGLPGSGKTTLGKKIAEALHLSFVDLDKEIERREGRLIREIFNEKNESYFRVLETNELATWCESDKSFIMATGGGAPCFHGNMEMINKAGTTVFLDIPASEIARRIEKTNVQERPLLAARGVDGLKDSIELMRTNRLSTYQKAHFTFGPNDTADRIVAALKR
jgi:shikimate kinase